MAQGAVIYAKDLDRLAEFYSNLEHEVVERADGDYVVMHSSQNPQSQLTIVQTPAAIAEQIDIKTPPKVRTDTPIKLTFITSSIDATLGRLEELGGISNAEVKRWLFRDYTHHDIVDPEGNVVQLKQRVQATGGTPLRAVKAAIESSILS